MCMDDSPPGSITILPYMSKGFSNLVLVRYFYIFQVDDLGYYNSQTYLNYHYVNIICLPKLGLGSKFRSTSEFYINLMQFREIFHMCVLLISNITLISNRKN